MVPEFSKNFESWRKKALIDEKENTQKADEFIKILMDTTKDIQERLSAAENLNVLSQLARPASSIGARLRYPLRKAI